LKPSAASASFAPVHRMKIAAAAATLAVLAGAGTASAATRTFTARIGPIKMDAYETRQASDPAPAPRVNGHVTAMHAHVVDAAGRPVPQQHVMLHHVFFANYGRFPGDRRGGDCDPRRAETFYGTGEEDQAVDLPAGYGYRVRRGERWRVGWMFMNHQPRAETVYLEYTFRVTDEPGLTDVKPYWISVSCQRNKIYSVPGNGGPGAVHTRSRTWVAPRGGRIAAAAAHAHGGALSVAVSEPRCGRRLLTSTARYGTAADPIYRLSPVLHEPAPRSMSALTTPTGWPIRRGDRLRITSRYSNEHPHSAVMGIMHLYVAAGGGRTERCPAPPTDVSEHRLAFPGAPGRDRPPQVTPQLSALDDAGVARPLDDLAGPLRVLRGDATVSVAAVRFRPRKLSILRGATVRWRFQDPILHDVTLASGPRAFASAYSDRGATYRKRFTVRGEYRIFCSLHPVALSQIVRVR
jgi:plastocyanin